MLHCLISQNVLTHRSVRQSIDYRLQIYVGVEIEMLLKEL
jgi:hypothetical protein